MAIILPWNTEEFVILLDNPQLTNEELSRQLTTRSIGAINVVRRFIHSFHAGGNISGLSNLMIHRLQQGSWVCPQCQKHINGEKNTNHLIHLPNTLPVPK